MDARIVLIGQVALAPVVLGVVLALVRGGTRQAALALAVAAFALMVAGTVIFDAMTGLRSEIAYIHAQGGMVGVGQAVLNVDSALVILGAGVTLLAAATALALHDAARAGRRRWFVALLATQVLAALFVAAFNQSLVYLFPNWPQGVELIQRVNAGEPGVSVPYFLVTSALIVASPLVALLYCLRDRRATTADATSA